MKKKKTKELLRENKILRKRLERAERQLKKLTISDEAHSLAKAAAGSAKLFCESDTYIAYAKKSLRFGTFYAGIRSAVRLFSRFRIVSTGMRMLAAAVAVIETGTHIVLLSTLAVILLPVSAVLSLVTLMISYNGSDNANEALSPLTEGKDVYILLPGFSPASQDCNFFSEMIKALSKKPNALVFTVPPSFSGKRLRDGFYLHYRRDSENVITLRKYYYFNFRRNVIGKGLAESVTVIY